MFIHDHLAPRRECMILTCLFVLAFLGESLFGQAPASPTPSAVAPAVPPDKPWYQSLSFSGLVSTSFIVNTNIPVSRTNQFRVFDADDRSFTLDVVELVLQRVTEFTITPEFRRHPNLILRGDLRRDRSNRPVFERHNGTFTTSQMTLSVNGLFVF